MKIFDVNIQVPIGEAESDLILISGLPNNVEAAKMGLAETVAKLKAEMEDFNSSTSIGQKGAPITKLRWGRILYFPWMESNSWVWLGMTAQLTAS